MLNVFLSILPIFILIVMGYLSKRFIRNVTFFFWADKFFYYLFFPALLILDPSDSCFSGNDAFYSIVSTVVATLLISTVIFIGRFVLSSP